VGAVVEGITRIGIFALTSPEPVHGLLPLPLPLDAHVLGMAKLSVPLEFVTVILAGAALFPPVPAPL